MLMLEEIRARQDQIADGAFAWSNERFNLSATGETDPVDGIFASGRIFDVLGVSAIRGRTFTQSDDDRRGGPDGPVAVISYEFWQRRFAGADAAVGRTLSIDRTPFTIVGVTSQGFFGPEVGRSADVMVPLGTEAIVRGVESSLGQRSSWWLNPSLPRTLPAKRSTRQVCPPRRVTRLPASSLCLLTAAGFSFNFPLLLP